MTHTQSSLKGFKIKNSTRQVHCFHFIDHKAHGLNELHGHTPSAGSAEKTQISFVTLHLGNKKPSKYLGKWAQRCEASWLQSPGQEWDLAARMACSSSCHSWAQVAARLICKMPSLPGRSLSHRFQNRILDEASIQLKLHFLTNSNPNSKLTNLVLLLPFFAFFFPCAIWLVNVILRWDTKC